MLLLIIAVMVLLLYGCNDLFHQDNVKKFIPGTYIAAWKSPFSEARDTMQITPVVQQGSEGFLITRRTYTSFINAARKRDPEYTIVHWSANYDTGNKTLFINNNGKALFFDPGKKEMKMGVVTYKKL